jgi:hypothetical protein
MAEFFHAAKITRFSHRAKRLLRRTLATVLDLLSQNLQKEGHIRNAEMLGRLRDDLMYLQRSYRIEEIHA